MTEDRYLAKDSPDAFERERLALLTQFADPITTRRLTDLGVGRGWRCLEVGAGNGSIARWLASRVGSEGRVVATDLNPRFLGGQGCPTSRFASTTSLRASWRQPTTTSSTAVPS